MLSRTVATIVRTVRTTITSGFYKSRESGFPHPESNVDLFYFLGVCSINPEVVCCCLLLLVPNSKLAHGRKTLRNTLCRKEEKPISPTGFPAVSEGGSVVELAKRSYFTRRVHERSNAPEQ